MTELYLGDYREIIERVNFDAIVSDPPYGIEFNYGGIYKDKGGESYRELLEPLAGWPLALLNYPEDGIREFVPVFGPPEQCFIWAYHANTAKQSRMWFFWGLDVDFGRVRVPAKNPTDARVSSHVAHYDWCTDIQQVKNVSEEKEAHPCQVPVRLMERVLKFLDVKSIFDPFMGSGTTGVACANLGVSFVGAEIDERFFRIAQERIKQATAQQRLIA